MPDKAQMPLKALAKSALLCQVPSIEQCTLHRTRACTLHYHTKHDTTGDTAKIRKGLRFSTWREGIRYLSTYFLFLFIYPALQKRRSPFRLAPCVHRCVSPVEYTPYANALKYSPLLDEICGARHLSRVNSWQWILQLLVRVCEFVADTHGCMRTCAKRWVCAVVRSLQRASSFFFPNCSIPLALRNSVVHVSPIFSFFVPSTKRPCNAHHWSEVTRGHVISYSSSFFSQSLFYFFFESKQLLSRLLKKEIRDSKNFPTPRRYISGLYVMEYSSISSFPPFFFPFIFFFSSCHGTFLKPGVRS